MGAPEKKPLEISSEFRVVRPTKSTEGKVLSCGHTHWTSGAITHKLSAAHYLLIETSQWQQLGLLLCDFSETRLLQRLQNWKREFHKILSFRIAPIEDIDQKVVEEPWIRSSTNPLDMTENLGKPVSVNSTESPAELEPWTVNIRDVSGRIMNFYCQSLCSSIWRRGL